MPGMNSTGMNTATSETVIEMTVKPISRVPSSAACMRDLPISMWRWMFSSTTMASSTTKPTASVSASSEILSRLKSNRYMPAKVPTIDRGSTIDGIAVATRLRRNRKMTMTTRQVTSTSLN